MVAYPPRLVGARVRQLIHKSMYALVLLGCCAGAGPSGDARLVRAKRGVRQKVLGAAGLPRARALRVDDHDTHLHVPQSIL